MHLLIQPCDFSLLLQVSSDFC